MSSLYDQSVHRLQNMTPFNVQKLGPNGPEDWWEVHPKDLVGIVIVHPAGLLADVQQAGVQQMEWARHVAQTQRVWEIHERILRTWKAGQVVKGKEADPKAAISFLEAQYRTDPHYAVLAQNVERAAEAHNCAQAVLDAVKLKAQMLRTFVRRGRDGNPEILAD